MDSEAEAADVVAEDQAVEAAEVAESRSLSSHTDTAESSSPRARKTSLSPRTWFPETPFTAKRKLR